MPKPTGPGKSRSAPRTTPARQVTRGNAASRSGVSQAALVGDRRDEILDSAALLFATKGVANTTVRDIGKAVGMLSGSLYYYFDSKESMVAEILTNYLQARLEECEYIAEEFPEPRSRIEELLRTEFRDADEQAAAQIYLQEYLHLPDLPVEVRDAARGVQRCWVAAIEEGVRRNVFRKDIDREIFYFLARISTSLAHHLVGALSDPQPLGKRHRTKDIATDTIEILLDGFAAKR